MNQILQFALRKYVLVFFDDILVYSPNWSRHMEHLEIMLFTLIKHHLYAKHSRCSFGLTQVEYLGHVVSTKGVEMDKSKTEAIL